MSNNPIPDFDYNLIKIMNEVIASGNLSRAAKKLSMSIPSVSISIAKLQQQLGTELFTRTSTGLKPTRTAMEINNNFLHAIKIIDKTLESSLTSRKDERIINVLCSDISESYYFYRLFQTEEFSKLKFSFVNNSKFSNEDYVNHLLRFNSDLIISSQPITNAEITSIHIDSHDDFVAVCSKKSFLIDKSHLTLAQYHAMPHAVYSCNGIPIVHYYLNNESTDNQSPARMIQIAYHSSSINGIFSAIKHRELIAILPRKIFDFYSLSHQNQFLALSLPDNIICEKVSMYASFKKISNVNPDMNKVVSFLSENMIT